MFGAIYIPEFFLQAKLRNPAESRPVALIDMSAAESPDGKARILDLTNAARQAGVLPGMTAPQGQARCGDLFIVRRCAEAEEKAQQILLQLASECTPDFENTHPGAVIFDLSAAECGAGWELGWNLVEQLETAFSLRARIGFAPTPDLALMTARHADPVYSLVGKTESQDDFLLRLPVASLVLPPDISMVLSLWGIATIGDFLALPKDEMSGRLGPEALDCREKIEGTKSRLLRLVRPPRDFSESIEFDFEVNTVEPLLFALRRQLESICARLEAAWLAAGEIRICLAFENGSLHHRVFCIPDPTTETEFLVRLLQIHLENFAAQASITALRVEAIPARPVRRQTLLFQSGLRDANRFVETLGRLEALLGPGRVGRPRSGKTYRPDGFEMISFQEPGVADSAESNGFRLGLPLRRFRPALLAEVATVAEKEGNHRPVQISSSMIRGKIRGCRGPWRSSGEWWAKNVYWSRTEWDIEMVSGGLYRIVNQVIKKRQSSWRIEGVYG